jgi:hypothetical protein
MNQNKLPEKLTSVEKIVQRLKAAELSNQKEFRMSVQEARDIVIDLSILTSKMANHVQDIKDRLDKLEANQGNIEVKFDGGSF